MTGPNLRAQIDALDRYIFRSQGEPRAEIVRDGNFLAYADVVHAIQAAEQQPAAPMPAARGEAAPLDIAAVQRRERAADAGGVHIARGTPPRDAPSADDVRRLEQARNAWREYAEHAAGCVDCGLTSWENCGEGGKALRAAAYAADEAAAGERQGDTQTDDGRAAPSAGPCANCGQPKAYPYHQQAGPDLLCRQTPRALLQYRAAAPASGASPILCAECREPCDPAYRGREWGEWHDEADVLRPVHMWCVEAWSMARRWTPAQWRR